MVKATFKKATKKQSRLRMAIDGPSGSGKTFTGLTFACALANGGRVAVIDTERGSASKYADMFDFDVLELDNYHPQQYVDGIQAAEEAGYDVILIDSLSHAWEGEGGVLDLHDQATKRQRTENSYTAWKDITPIHRKLVDAMLQSKCHIVATMRSKTEYVLVTNSQGKQEPKKVGMAPVQRQGMEYEFDIVADMDTDHNMIVSKSRCFAVADDVVNKPTSAWFQAVKTWLTDGAPVAEEGAQDAQDNHAESSESKGQTSSKPTTATKTSQPEPTNAGYAFWSQELKDKFWAKANGLLPVGVTLEEFGVEDIDNYTGSQGHAATVLHVIDAGLKRGLTIKQMHTALAVKRMDEVADSVETATAKLESYITAQSNRKQETML
jgi:hypothetical protein